MMCNCENSHCRACGAKGCKNEANPAKRAMYIGPICDACAEYMPVEYMLPEENKCES